jgi:hypothetical protein
VVGKTSRPPARTSRAASGTRRAGSHHKLAPHSDTARSKLPDGSGTSPASASMSGTKTPDRSWQRRGGELAPGEVDPGRPGSPSGQPGGEVRGPAAGLDHVHAADVAGHAELLPGHVEDAPRDVAGVPGLVTVLIAVLAVRPRPQVPVGSRLGCRISSVSHPVPPITAPGACRHPCFSRKGMRGHSHTHTE